MRPIPRVVGSDRGEIVVRIGFDVRMLHFGGIGRYVSALVRHYPGLVRGEEMVLFAHPRDFVSIHSHAPNFDLHGISSSIYSIAEHFEMALQLRRVGLDLLHVPHYTPPLRAPCPLVVTIHDLIHLHYPRSRLHEAYTRRMLSEVRRRASMVLVGSQAVAQDVVECADIEPERVRVIPYGVEDDWAAPSEGTEVEAFLRRMRIERPYVLNVTNGLPHKGLPLLLEAFREFLPEALRAEGGGVRLVLAGRGSNRPEVMEDIADCGLGEDTVLALGGLSEREMRLAYASAAAVVVASDYEGFGLPVLEGLAAGVPVIASDVGGLPEAAGDAGFLFESGSVAALVAALYKVVLGLSGEEREQCIREGITQAKRFSWETTARATLAAYQRALSY